MCRKLAGQSGKYFSEETFDSLKDEDGFVSTSSVLEISRKPLALVYMGGASPKESECPQAVEEALKSAGFNVLFAGDEKGSEFDVPTALSTFNPALYVQPGGGDDMSAAWDSVNSSKEAIASYVTNGGRYIGICMGSFLSSKGAEGDGFEGYQLLTKAGWDAADYKERAGAEVTDMGQTLLKVSWRGIDSSIFFQGGPCFVPLDDSVEAEGEIIAKYQNGDAAAIVVPYGAGKVSS
jgi:hypothetical protein